MKRVETGITGLDEMLGGGLPDQRVVLVSGGPGTGKTIFCSQFLHYGAVQQNESGVYISLDETKHHFLKEMQAFSWDFQDLEQNARFNFIDASRLRRIPEEAQVGRLSVGGRELGIANLIDMINTTIKKLEARRVVLDSISGLVFRYPKASERRLAALDIIDALTATGATCLVTSEVQSMGDARQVQPEEYLSHGVATLQTLKTGERVVQILKMRGTKVDTVPRPYVINETGVEVYSTQSVYQV